MVFFIDEARSRPPPPLLTNVNNKMFFFTEGFPYLWTVGAEECDTITDDTCPVLYC